MGSKRVEGQRLMYLSSDGEHELQELPEDATLIVGGLVDRNRNKGLTHNLASEKGIPTYRLPLDLKLHMGAKLTCNQVVEMLVRFQKKKESMPPKQAWSEAALESI